jgi:hypothetical protein
VASSNLTIHEYGSKSRLDLLDVATWLARFAGRLRKHRTIQPKEGRSKLPRSSLTTIKRSGSSEVLPHIVAGAEPYPAESHRPAGAETLPIPG